MVKEISIANVIGSIICIAASIFGAVYWYLYGFKFKEGMGYLAFHLSLDPYFLCIGLLVIGLTALYSSLRRSIQ